MSNYREPVTGPDGCVYLPGGSDINLGAHYYYHDNDNCPNNHDHDDGTTGYYNYYGTATVWHEGMAADV